LAFAFPVGSSGTSSGNAAAQMGQISESAGPVQSFQTDLFTGRAQTSIPIFVPPGRKNIQPNLNLSYSSSGGNSWLGGGWSLDLGFIQRDVKKGVPKYDSTDKFVFSFQGVYSELVSVGTNEYRAKDEALFLKFIHDPAGNSWTVTDKSGTKHFFGLSPACRQTNSLGTFKWAISKVKDTSGNTMTISHTTDQGEMYLSEIEYNANETQSFAATHKVEFTLEDREDDMVSYLTGARVETNKRLKEILVKVKDSQGAYQLARKYAITYETSSSTSRSRLKTVTECGKDGLTCLPAVTFTYQDKPVGFDSAADYTNVQNDSFLGGGGSYVRSASIDGAGWGLGAGEFLDFDGDGRHDRVQRTSTDGTWKLFRNNGTGFENSQNITNVGYPSSASQYRYVRGSSDAGEGRVELLDMNGDGWADRVIAEGNSTWFYQKNNGTNFENSVSIGTILDAGFYRRLYISYSTPGAASDTQADLADMNGDGFPDRVLKKDDETDRLKVQINTLDSNGNPSFSSTYTDFTGLDIPGSASSCYRNVRCYGPNGAGYSLADLDLIDMNGDGLPDRIMTNPTDYTKWKVQYNTGRGFAAMEDWGPIENLQAGNNANYERLRSRSDSYETHVDLVDVNSDGLPDRVVFANDANNNWKVQHNTGKGFAATVTLTGLENPYSMPRDWYMRRYDSAGGVITDLADVNGDGLIDRVITTSAGTVWKLQKGKGPYPDLLSEINNGRGGKTVITYSPSTQFDNTDTSGKQRLPFPIQVVTQVKQQDGMGNEVVTNYSYKGGMYDSVSREFRGFREVTVTDAAGTKSIHTFGQTDHNKGRLLQKEVKDSSGNLFTKEVNTWDDTHPYTDVHFVFLSQEDDYVYDGDSSYKHTRKEYTYDSYGNLASITERGDMGVSGDERKTVNEYVYNTTDYILNALSKSTIYDSDFTTVRVEKYSYYDGATSITTAPTKGLLTKEEKWLNTASGCGTPGVCTNNPKTAMTYDSYGNLATITDPRGYTTTNTYETTYRIFLVTISNPLTQTSQFTYDPWFAQILTSTDQNGQVLETQYDALGRLTKVVAPLDSSTEPTQEFVYDLSVVPNKTTHKVKSSIPGQTFTQQITYSFTDGLGREIQRRSSAEDSGQQIISGSVEFDSRGLVAKQYVPYFATSSTSYVAPDTSKPKATFTYDAVSRRTRVDYPDGTNSQTAFSDFVTTHTDQRGKQLRHTKDAYGRLVKVEEFNSGSTYTTTYEFDVKSNMTKTTDNAGNQNTMTYDSLSRKTAMADSDMGSWSYTYDLNNNLASQTDAKNQTISFTYDAMNRVTLKDVPAPDTDVTYSYDSAPSGYSGQTGYWVGRLAKVTDGSGTHEFLYDKEGRLLKDKKTVDSTAYEFVRTYDSMGRIRTLTYPDTEVVTYTYNGFGDVETIQGVKNSVTTDYIKDVNYNAAGQVTFTKYGNNVTSDYTYNANTLRLDRILTQKPDGTTKLQDLNYTFDGNGNVTQISDVVNSNSQTFTYDDLNRLTQAVGSAYGAQNFAYDPLGNMTTKGNLTLSYSNTSHKHAVSSVSWSTGQGPSYCQSSPCSFTYDANGNMTGRASDTLTYDSENRLKDITAYEGTTNTQSYTLKPGWNVISFTWLPDNKLVSNILSSLTFGTDYDQVSTWDSTSSSWKHWVNDSDFNDFTEFQRGKTYEIYNQTASDKTFSVTGKSSGPNISHSIVSGDNFISPAVKIASNVTTVLSGLTLGTHYSDVKRFNATSQTWESYASSQFTQFEPGKGYNIIGLTNASFSYGETTQTTTFVYNSTGARIKKTVGSTTTIYFGKDYEVEGSNSTKYIYFGDRRVSTKKSNGDVFFIHTDHINSTNVVTDSSGNQSLLLEYDPYGQTATFTGSEDLKFKFTGQERDESTKLYFYAWRYYDPQIGRFIVPDTIVPNPSDPQDLNRYSYVNNNPVKYTDPTGHKKFWKKFWKAFVGAFVGALVTVLTFGAGAPLWLAGMIGGMLGGSITGALNGGLKGALLGAAFGAGLGAIGGWGVSNFGWGFGVAMLGGAIAVAAATKDWGSFAGGLAGGYLGSQVGQGINSALYDGIVVQGKEGGITKGLGAGTTDAKALGELQVSSDKGVTSVVYIRSRGVLADIVRGGIELVFKNTTGARQMGDYMKQNLNASWDLHSEMTILARNAAESLPPGTKIGGTFKLYSPFYSEASANEVFKGIGARVVWNPPNMFDFSGTFAYASTNPPKAVVSGVAGATTLGLGHGRGRYD